MHRRGFVAVAAGTTLSALVASFGGDGDVAEARKRGRNRGDSASARARITGTGGHVSVSVNCGSGGSSSNQASGPPSHGGHDDGTEVSARC